MSLSTSLTGIPAPSSPSQGNVLYYNGTAWVKLAPGTSGQYLQTLGAAANPAWATVAASSGNWTLVSTKTGDGTSANLDWTGLDINTDGYYVMVGNLICTGGAANGSLFVNNDTTSTNYYTQTLSADGAVPSSNRGNNAITADVSNAWGNTLFIKIYRCNGFAVSTNESKILDGSSIRIRLYYGTTASTVTNITRLTLNADSGRNWATGTSVSLYKVTTA